MKGILVSDFDGTMTRQDFYQLVRARWWEHVPADPWQEYVDGRATHFAALAKYFAGVRTDEADLHRLIERMDPDPRLLDAVSKLERAGWEIVVASAGCDYYIRYLFARAGIRPVLHANPGTFSPETGVKMELPTTSPFYSPAFGIDKCAVVRDALARAERVAYAGDGPPDLPPTLLVEGRFRFARGWLAEKLKSLGEPFTPFERWSEIAEHLAAMK